MKDFYPKDGGPDVLYFPGRHRDRDELWRFFELLEENHNASISTVPIPYDTGEEFSEIPFIDYFQHFGRKKTTWWIGLSLGAAISWILASKVPAFLCPKRLIMINSFADREELARIRGFCLRGQWNLKPTLFNPDKSINVEIVLSRNDEKIPLCCIADMIGRFPPSHVHYIDSDHAVSSSRDQELLFNILCPRQTCPPNVLPY